MGQRIRHRRDTSAGWTLANPVLDDSEIGYDKTNKTFKIGDGVTAWSLLQIYSPLKKFISTDIALVANATYTIAHGLGAVPDMSNVYLKSLIAQANYVVGDLVDLASTSNAHQIASISFDATNIYVKMLALTNISIYSKTMGGSVAMPLTAYSLVIKCMKVN